MTPRFLLGLLASFVLLCSGCKEVAATGGTSGVALYAYDSTSSAVFVWTDLSAVYDGNATTVAPTKQITSSVFTSKIDSLTWGGMCFDRQRAYLYLVSVTGNIVRVRNVRSQSGDVPSTDVVSFALSSTGRLSVSTFGQVALDGDNDTLYITENGSAGTQIWVVSNASTLGQSATIELQALKTNGDTGGTGVAADGGSVYGFMLDGDTVGSVTDVYSGPRLRKGTSTAFTDTNTLIGPVTLLGKYGSLAYDRGNSNLFVARHNTDAGASTSPILVFASGMFNSGGHNQAPKSIGSATSQSDLRVIAHAGNKDWLLGLRGNGTTAYNAIYIWKSPLGGTAAKVISASSAPSLFRGAALDGNAS